MALSPLASLLVFESVWLGSLHVALQPLGPSKGRSCTMPSLLPGCLLQQVLEALQFLQTHWHVHGSLSSHAVQLVWPVLAKVTTCLTCMPSVPA